MNEFKLNKIPLSDLIDQLIELYDSGANFVDIVGHNGENKDTIGILVRNEYVTYNRHPEDRYKGTDPEEDIQERPLTDEDLNQLLQNE